MKERILYIIPDYSYATLHLLNYFIKEQSFEVHIAAAYDIKILNNPFAKKVNYLKRRLAEWNKVEYNAEIKIISNNIFNLLWITFKIYLEVKKVALSSAMRNNLQHRVIKKINFSEYKAIYNFDGCSLLFQKAAKEKGLVTIMESRGNHIDFVLDMNKKINRTFNSKLPEEKEMGEKWILKLREEVNYSDFIITYSEFQREQFLKRLTTRDTLVFKIPISSRFGFRIKPKLYNNSFQFVFIGNQSTAKGLDLLKEIWYKRINEIPDNISLSIIGNISLENADFEKMKRINYLGYFPPEDLKKYFSDNDLVLIHPSFYESYGMIIAEALSYCIPVITNQYCGAAELIINNRYGLVYDNPFNTGKLEEMIISIVQYPSIARAFSENIANSFDPSIVENQRNEEMGKLIQSIKTKLK